MILHFILSLISLVAYFLLKLIEFHCTVILSIDSYQWFVIVVQHRNKIQNNNRSESYLHM